MSLRILASIWWWSPLLITATIFSASSTRTPLSAWKRETKLRYSWFVVIIFKKLRAIFAHSALSTFVRLKSRLLEGYHVNLDTVLPCFLS